MVNQSNLMANIREVHLALRKFEDKKLDYYSNGRESIQRHLVSLEFKLRKIILLQVIFGVLFALGLLYLYWSVKHNNPDIYAQPPVEPGPPEPPTKSLYAPLFHFLLWASLVVFAIVAFFRHFMDLLPASQRQF
uniref:Uncharacterized protein n=1 Tax=Pleurozia purpurea TaxID=280637 RepID=D0R054_9MARC|nr:hypothetical protein PlpuMp55 [Pleurozia purpurea]ACR19391.1 hypothetical protein PlpuMp55 [Pleurozia purpurea]